MCDASLAKFDLRAMGRGFLQMNLYVAQQPYVCMTMCTNSPAVRGPGGHCDSAFLALVSAHRVACGR